MWRITIKIYNIVENKNKYIRKKQGVTVIHSKLNTIFFKKKKNKLPIHLFMFDAKLNRFQRFIT